MHKLPKGLKDHPHFDIIEAWISSQRVKLRRDGDPSVIELVWTDAVATALRVVQSDHHLLQGLEQIARTLDNEQKGLKKVANRTPGPPRLSRLLLVSNDGADRFYRQVEGILTAHADRLIGIRVDADSSVLGDLFSTKKQHVKALFIKDRKALETFLIAVTPGIPPR